jgi:hypothetical protein
MAGKILAAGVLLISVSTSFSQSGSAARDAQSEPINPESPNGLTPEQIIHKLALKETECKQARDQYTYQQSVKIQVLNGFDVVGEYEQVSDIVQDDKGRRVERVRYAPQSSIGMTKEDFANIRSVIPFMLTSDELPEYQVVYRGQQHVDELDTYVFDVAPKLIQKERRYFQGRIWIDKDDLQIVKIYGKPVPEVRITRPKKQKHLEENLFPHFTTYRELIDGHWFPTYSRADEVLHFSNGQDAHYRMTVKYTGYQLLNVGKDASAQNGNAHGNQPAGDKGKSPLK